MALTIKNEVNPIHVTGTETSSVAITTNKVFIKFIYWYKPTTIGNLLSLTDKDGNTIIKLYCDTADMCQQWAIGTTFDGIYCDDMDSGELLIYIQ